MMDRINFITIMFSYLLLIYIFVQIKHIQITFNSDMAMLDRYYNESNMKQNDSEVVMASFNLYRDRD